LESFNKLSTAAAPAPNRLSTYDWVKEKATELKGGAHNYLADKNNRQLAIEGVTLAAGLAASALLHVNLSKSGKLVEGLPAGKTETAAIGEKVRALAVGNEEAVKSTKFEKLLLRTPIEAVNSEKQPFALAVTDRIKPVSFSSDTVFEGGFTLPRHMSARTVAQTPPTLIKTRVLPRIDDPDFDRKVAHRLNLRLDLAEENSIGILHPRFRNGAKQMTMLKSLDRNLSLYGNNESGVGVLEFERLPSKRPYFKHADSVVQIKFSGDSSGVGSGTLISEDGLIATAGHVVPADRKIMVDTIKGRFEAEVVVREFDGYADRAAIQLLGVPKDISFPVPPMTSANLKANMRAATVGHPQGLSGRFASVGHYLKDLDFSDEHLKGVHPIFVMDTTMSGHSGGPIFDAEGNLAAIVTDRFAPAEHNPLLALNRGLVVGDRIEDLLALLKTHRQV
jgi:hypothetical protein